MESIKDDAIHNTAMKLAEELKNLSIYKSIYSDVQKLVSSPNVNKEDFKQSLQQAMKEKGLDTKLRNTVFHWVRTQGKQSKLDPLTSLSKASLQWEKRIHKSLNSMCSDLETSLAKIRSQSEQEELTEKWNELSTYSLDLSKYRPVYAPKDFLDVLLTLSGYVPFTREDEPKWEFSHLPLQVKNLEQLRKIYVEWCNGEPLLGVNPNMPSTVPGFATLEAERIGLGERVSALGYAPVIQEFLKKGSPQCLRARLWSQVLGAEVKQQQIAYFNQLQKSVLEVDLMIDKLIFKDVQLTASNDDQYFVFEDLLYQVMLCFSRDGEVLSRARSTALTVPVRGRNERTAFPPSGVVPFHGFTMYATPFCYLYDDPVQLYYIFRAFYIRYWHRLHYISTHPQGIVSLCLLYERLLEAHEPLLWIHFRNININPIRVVFKWIMRAFSGHLPPDQLLLLWDSILGYDCLEILPLLAVAILSFRKENIFQVNTLQNVDAVLADLSTISVVPLLQLALMKS
ncbi:TBC1 domain family member 19 [Danaus plexippus]|uniref:TBC1 domain family member 19 isoform 2 n=1 Tax=Danaus plexippus plexippus TaxID=278856 RepID=A0A212ETN2_DANPL|nr:TBC1 domain family member 19 [Danaus plexippus]OWR44853.1 TBC1 domain family member 19 isoform 2 [Danaus plexippus plexippus]